MKSKKLHLFCLVLTAIFLFSSCSKNDGTAFMKKKYTDFAVNKKRVEPAEVKETVKIEESKTVIAEEKQVAEVSSSVIEENIVASSNDQPLVLDGPKLNLKDPVKAEKRVISVPAEEKKLTFKEFKRELKKAKRETMTKGSDNMVLLVICAIFIPPLAVYLKEGAITTNFWIDLVLTLLFWIPGMIFAFLVVFDVI